MTAKAQLWLGKTAAAVKHTHPLVPRSAEGASRRDGRAHGFSGACFETQGYASLLSMRVVARRPGAPDRACP
jgi:hypothetical protein